MYPAAEFMTLDGELFCFDDYEAGDFREIQSRPITEFATL
jgi:ATP-dependent DNA ligase